MSTAHYDAVVIGAGTAGANAAYQLARAGLRVALVERRDWGAGGARWHNGLLDRHFARAGLARPAGAERVRDDSTVHLLGPDGTRAATVRDSPVVTVDMVRLGSRLRGLALDAGVHPVPRAAPAGVEVVDGRLRAVTLRRTGEAAGGPTGDPLRLSAELTVDAGGRGGVLRRHHPTLARWCPPVRGGELCSAADVRLGVAEPAGAAAWLERHGARPGETVTVVGTDGGVLDPGGDRVGRPRRGGSPGGLPGRRQPPRGATDAGRAARGEPVDG